MADPAFVPLRPPVLGLAIHFDKDRDLYRLVRVEPAEGMASAVLAEGDLSACEQALIADLESRYGGGLPNIKLATFGGLQLWGDRMWLGGWRIQEHVYTGHFRLLSPDNQRQAWGSWEACRIALETVRVEGRLREPKPQLVVLVHGLGRATSSWSKMEEGLSAAGWDVASIAYPSTRRSLAEHAAQLASLLDRAEGLREVSFVTHSLGGLVVRAMLAREGDPWRERIRIGRLVMLAPPSQGSAIAEGMQGFLPFELLAGPVGRELSVKNGGLLPLPPCEFAIVAGGKGDGKGWNPLLEGDDDGVVTVDETRLEGAADFLVVDRVHTWLMRSPQVIAAVVSFLDSGRFDSEGDEGG